MIKSLLVVNKLNKKIFRRKHFNFSTIFFFYFFSGLNVAELILEVQAEYFFLWAGIWGNQNAKVHLSKFRLEDDLISWVSRLLAEFQNSQRVLDACRFPLPVVSIWSDLPLQ
ncbi:hypothetical protein ACOSP7_014142 [Xanthoceras sorbifolium]